MEQLFSQILNKIADPIMALLMLCLFGVIYFLYKSYKEKDKEIKEQNQVLLSIITSDKEVIIELKNTVTRFIEIEKDQTEASKTAGENLRRNNELLMQILAKMEYTISKIG